MSNIWENVSWSPGRFPCMNARRLLLAWVAGEFQSEIAEDLSLLARTPGCRWPARAENSRLVRHVDARLKKLGIEHHLQFARLVFQVLAPLKLQELVEIHLMDSSTTPLDKFLRFSLFADLGVTVVV